MRPATYLSNPAPSDDIDTLSSDRLREVVTCADEQEAYVGNPVVHFDIGCRDKEQSRRFYEKMFGWKSEPRTRSAGPTRNVFATLA